MAERLWRLGSLRALEVSYTFGDIGKRKISALWTAGRGARTSVTGQSLDALYRITPLSCAHRKHLCCSAWHG